MEVVEVRDQEVHNHSRYVYVADAPVLDTHGFSHKEKQFRPNHFAARWDHGQPIKTIRVSGWLLKKDGTEGRVKVSLEFATPYGLATNSASWRILAPDWMLELFADAPHTGATSD
jgi:hypothetical protein